MEQLFLQAAQTQGLSVAMLLIGAWVLYKRMLTLESKIEVLQNERGTERGQLIAVIVELKTVITENQSIIKVNTDVIQKIGDFMEDNLVVAKKKTL